MSVTFRFLENCYNSEISSKSIWLKGKIEFVENSGKSILPRAPLDSSPQASTFPSVPHLRRRNLHSITSKARKWDGKVKYIRSHPQSKVLSYCVNGLGTRYFDDDWFLSGMGERKKTHINDLIDSAIFIKENELAPKLAVCATNPSGSLTALTSVF